MTVDVSVVVAVYNEDPRNLHILLERLEKVITPSGLSYEVVFVNDGSRAPTSKALLDIATAQEHVKLVVLSRNFGQQAAISAGLDHASGNAIINIDSDCQDPPELIPDMLNYWQQGYDVVYAQRLARKDRLGKRLSAFLFYRLLGCVSSVNIPWDTGDFRLMDRKVIDALAMMPEKSRFLRGQIPWLGFRQIGIPIERGAREIGESTYTLKKLLQLALDGLLAFSVAPLYLVPGLGGLVFLGGLLALAAGAVAQAVNQPASILVWTGALLATFTGLQILCLGFVAVYLSKVVDEVRARPLYVVAERVGLGFASDAAYGFVTDNARVRGAQLKNGSAEEPAPVSVKQDARAIPANAQLDAGNPAGSRA
jgi:dolichol-phosphate mannosyltransferase